MHGYERCGKDFGVDHHKLHVRLYALKRKNEGRVLESRQQTITAQASEILVCDGIKHEAASTRTAWFWSFKDLGCQWFSLTKSKPSAGLTI